MKLRWRQGQTCIVVPQVVMVWCSAYSMPAQGTVVAASSLTQATPMPYSLQCMVMVDALGHAAC
jgi:hypothetical protein